MLVTINKPISPDFKVFKNNPWLRHYPPYNKLLKEFGEELADKYMIAVYMMCEPDEMENPFFRMDEEYRKQVITENYVEVDWDNAIIKECLDSYPFDWLETVPRALKEEKESLKQRAKFLKETDITLDHTDIKIDPKTGKEYALQIKGTATQLEQMRKNTENIYKQYEKVESKYLKQKTQATVRGGGRMTKAEQKQI